MGDVKQPCGGLPGFPLSSFIGLVLVFCIAFPCVLLPGQPLTVGFRECRFSVYSPSCSHICDSVIYPEHGEAPSHSTMCICVCMCVYASLYVYIYIYMYVCMLCRKGSVDLCSHTGMLTVRPSSTRRLPPNLRQIITDVKT